jgi:hypothetical protein
MLYYIYAAVKKVSLNNSGNYYNSENHRQTSLVQAGFETAFRVCRGPENARANRMLLESAPLLIISFFLIGGTFKQEQALQVFESRAFRKRAVSDRFLCLFIECSVSFVIISLWWKNF